MTTWEDKRREQREYLEHCKLAYQVAYKLTSDTMRTRLKGSRGFEAIEEAQDIAGLLKLMKGICCQSDDNIHPGWAVIQAKKRVYLYVQSYNTSNDKYVKEFEAFVKVVETYGGTFVEPVLVEIELDKMGVTTESTTSVLAEVADKEVLKEANKRAGKRAQALLILANSYLTRNDEIFKRLHNNWVEGEDTYPTTPEDAVRLLNNYKSMLPTQSQAQDGGGNNNNGSEDLVFIEEGETIESLQRKLKAKQNAVAKANGRKKGSCWYCGTDDHLKKDCPKRKADLKAKAQQEREEERSTGSGGSRSEASPAIDALNFEMFELSKGEDDFELFCYGEETEDAWIQGDGESVGSELTDLSDGMPPLLEAPESSSSDDSESGKESSGIWAGDSSMDTRDFVASWTTSVHEIEDLSSSTGSEGSMSSSVGSEGSSISSSEGSQRKPMVDTSQVPALLEAGDRPCEPKDCDSSFPEFLRTLQPSDPQDGPKFVTRPVCYVLSLCVS